MTRAEGTSSQGRRIGIRWAAAAFALYLAGAITLTWPLAKHLREATPSDFKDSRLLTWQFAWDAHVLGHGPTDLFQAPNFWPERDVTTYTDHVLGIAVFAAPVIWITGNPYLGHNLVFIAALAFSAWTAFMLASDLTGSRGAALVAGVAFGFAPYWFGPVIQTSHIQHTAYGWVPLVLLGVRRWLRTARLGPLALASISFVMASLTSWYQTAFLAVALLVVLPITALGYRPLPWRRLAVQGAAAAVLVAVVIAPIALPYRRTQDRFPEYTRSLADAEQYGARATSFLAATETNVLYGHATRSARAKQLTPETTLFPGIAVVALAITGVVARKRDRSERFAAAALVALLAVGAVLTFGGGTTGARRYLPWTFLFDHVILFRGLRAAARAHVLTLIALSGLSAFGVRRALNALPRRWSWRPAAAVGLAAVVALEGAAVPLKLGAAVRPSAAHRMLASRPGAILELPTGFKPPGRDTWSQTRAYDVDYMLMGTVHWRPLVNGYSGFEPPGYAIFMEAMASLPDERSLRLLRRDHVRTLVVHTDLLRRTPWRGLEERLTAVPGVRLIARAGRILVYDVAPA